MNGDYLDYLAHYKTPGAVNGVSHTKGYIAVGKPKMSDEERKARRKEEKWRRRFDKADKKAREQEAKGKNGVGAYARSIANSGSGRYPSRKRQGSGYAKHAYDRLVETRGSEYADRVLKTAKKKNCDCRSYGCNGCAGSNSSGAAYGGKRLKLISEYGEENFALMVNGPNSDFGEKALKAYTEAWERHAI